jgi:hypothetical protein
VALLGFSATRAQDPQCTTTPTPTPTPKSDRDKCQTDKDHDACKKYYRAGCLNKDASACENYAKELKIDCGPEPGRDTPPPQISAYLACARKAQCWQDRVIGIMQINDVCKADPEAAQCKEAKERFASVSVKACDNPQPNVF